MTRKLSQHGFSAIELVIALLVVAALSLGGFFIWQKTKSEPSKNSHSKTSQSEEKPAENSDTKDPTEAGEYLVVKEWSVRFPLPEDLKGEVAYSLSDPVVDPDGNTIQQAKILLKNNPSAGNDCDLVQNAQGDFVDTAAQILRVERGKPFNTQRYRWTFEENVLSDDKYVYHLNYVTPECAGSTTATQIEELQQALVRLEKI